MRGFFVLLDLFELLLRKVLENVLCLRAATALFCLFAAYDGIKE